MRSGKKFKHCFLDAEAAGSSPVAPTQLRGN